MNETRVSLVLRADGVFNLLAGLVLQFYIKPVLAIIGWPETETPIYATVLGSALIGLSLTVILAANRPQQHRTTIFASMIAKSLAGLSIVNAVLILHTSVPQPALLLGAVGAQVLFVLGEVAYLLSSRSSTVGAPAVQKV